MKHNGSISKEQSNGRKVRARRKNISQKTPAPAATNGANGALPYRPLTMERRAIRDLAHEAEMQIEELENLARRLIQIQEEQKQTISRELHDNVAQVLSVVTNRISLARETSKVPAWLRQELKDMQDNINTALSDIRILARDLRPSLLDHCGFAATLEKNGHDFRKRTGIDLEMQVERDATDFLATGELTHLFRLVQEAMQNIEEHSRAERAWIILEQSDSVMKLEIGDNGCAFTPQRVTEAQAGGHLGLLGMRERAELLGGNFELNATPGEGTIIRVSVPVTPPPPGKNLNLES
ncbi:MAG: hypothetical protein RIQ71_2316 [Verrucomicrobiota bacterium]|jgi:signal transduction histidine kinase